MNPIILIHGASQGGWIWPKVARQLADDNDVYLPTLTGMGDRVNLLDPSITLDTHIDDIVDVIQQNKLTNVVLVGYSYAGLIIPAVNEILSDKISQLIFLDSFIPQNGKTGFDILDPAERDKWLYVATKYGDGWCMPANEATLDSWGVYDPALRKFLLPKITPFSVNFMKSRVYLSDKFDRVNKHYIRCTQPCYVTDLMRPYYQQAKVAGWPVHDIDTTHAPMLTAPDNLAAILLQCF